MVTWLLFLNRSMEMQIQQNISLKPYNTFGIDATASHFAVFQSIEELEALITYAEEKSMPILILGGGSNMLLTQDYKGLVLRNELKGIAVVEGRP
jgi:UDP-N-acetylmuramate dehydrogenase